MYFCASKASKLSTGLLVGVRRRAGVAGSLEFATEFTREPLSSIVLRFVRAAKLPERAPRRSY